MSRLDSNVCRLKAQRACLTQAVMLIRTMPGPVLELGLGNGRTYDHLRQLLAREGLGREIFVFERKLAAHPDCIPDSEQMFLGDFRDTLGQARARLGARAVLAHADIGSADKEGTTATARFLAGALPLLLAPVALVVSDHNIPFVEGESLPLPAGSEPGRYFFWRFPKDIERLAEARKGWRRSRSPTTASQNNYCSTGAASRLDSFICRLEAQRSCLNLVAELVHDLEGPVLELGLGKGRTYDHLRELFPGREIFVFDRQVAAYPDCIPDPEHLFLGEIHDTLPAAVRRFERSVPLVHTDMGSGDREANRQLAAFIASQLPSLVQPGGFVVADQDVAFERAKALPLPDGVRPRRYFMYTAS